MKIKNSTKAKNILNSIAMIENRDMLSGALVVISAFRLLPPKDILIILEDLEKTSKEG
jgi:hypothetical protein